MLLDTPPTLSQLMDRLPPPFWKDPGYWLAFAIGTGGLVFAILAWIEARQAKRAATAAGRTVKLQTVAIELVEIVQKLSKVQPGIRFNEARDLLSDASSRIHRATSPFASEPKLLEAIEITKEAIRSAQQALKSVRPTESAKELEAPDAVYYGIEADCAATSDALSDLIGLFEKQTFNFGTDNAAS
jgi:hypothetical protein